MVETNGKQVAKPPGRVATTALASTIVCSLTLLYVMAPRLAHPQGMNALSIVGKGEAPTWFRRCSMQSVVRREEFCAGAALTLLGIWHLVHPAVLASLEL